MVCEGDSVNKGRHSSVVQRQQWAGLVPGVGSVGKTPTTLEEAGPANWWIVDGVCYTVLCFGEALLVCDDGG